jgi:GalNAc-alpha-(1->4)-GalNAc-alpha-(1->3)-diNAcBac-PP-undecaprenol alpha-1,4-N-acetyl-D-galactosaminyltransferase
MGTIVFIAHPLRMGGTEKTISNLTKYLSQYFHVYIIIVNFSGQYCKPAYTLPNDVKTFSVTYAPNALSYLKAVREIRCKVRSISSPVVLTFLCIPSILTLAACLFSSVPVICSERTHPEFTQGVPFHWRFLRRVIYPLRANRLVLQTVQIAKAFRFVESSRIIVIPNACNMKARTLISTPGYTDGFSPAMRLLFLGRHEYQKGVDLLLEAVSILSKTNSDIKLDVKIIGSGSLTKSYLDFIAQRDLAGIIQLLPAMQEVDEAILASHYVIIPSRWEGLSNVLVESLANGIPVIASQQASAGYILEGINGFIIKELSALSIAAAISRSYYSADKYPIIQRKAYESSFEFEADSINIRWLKLIYSMQEKSRLSNA